MSQSPLQPLLRVWETLVNKKNPISIALTGFFHLYYNPTFLPNFECQFLLYEKGVLYSL